jgi:hypothetical protein
MRLNSIDCQMTRIVIAAEKIYSLRQHESEWSIELHKHSILCKYWLTARKGMNSGYQTLLRTRDLYNQLSEEQKEGVKESLANISDKQYPGVVARETQRCINNKEEVLAHHQELRIKGMQQLKEIRARSGQEEKAKAIQKISNKESNRKDWQQIRQVMKPQERSNLNTIEIPMQDKDGEMTDDPDKAVTWQQVTDPVSIENKLKERNIRHIGQAEGTLFLTRFFNFHLNYPLY